MYLINTVYLNKAADVLMLFFANHGFPIREFLNLRLGSVHKDGVIDFEECIGRTGRFFEVSEW